MTPRKTRALFAGLALVPALLLSCSKQPAASPAGTPPPLKPPAAAAAAGDVSSPKNVSLAFASAIVGGDTAAMRAMSVGTESRMFVYYAGLSDLVASQHLFAEVFTAKFGGTCQLPEEIEHIGNLPPMPANYDQLTEQIDGDSATLVDSSGHPGVKLKKMDGAWKVDFFAADADLPPGAAEQMAAQEQQFAVVKKAFSQATAKILDGTYTDCKTALDDVMAVVKPQK